ncbi:peptidylprolyl isomerase [Natronosporangium hydrolyticum]|uniref:peptidylprolyl isomerase n=2 Tax=Natronosporangium hydrolyticum TaxID=2811111 RepID=A0A895YMT8_9ACTN|nr:peptidylprolyl isomerase [Natronosporangium hydrolyticum]
MAERQATAKKRRQFKIAGGAAGAVLLVLIGTIWAVTALGNDDPPASAADPGPTAPAPTGAPPAPGECEWLPEDVNVNPNLEEVGTPEVGDPPAGPATMSITTNHGPIEVEVDAEGAPCTYASFVHLADQEFYDDTNCHRMTTEGIFVLQCGDPSGTGAGGPTYKYAEENLPVEQQPAYPAGTVAMAKTQEPASTGSQFFIVYEDTELPPEYTVLGTVTEGLEIVQDVAADGVEDGTSDGAPATEVTIETLRIE